MIVTPPTPTPPVTAPSQNPVHPYAKAREPNYLPPHERNFASVPAKPKDVGYHIQAPIEDPKIASEVYMRWLKTSNVSVSPEELLSLSPELRNKVREAIHTRRMPVPHPTVPQAPVMTALVEEDPLPYAFETSFNAAHPSSSPGVIYIPDPYETYLKTVAPGDVPEVLRVAAESHALRSIKFLVDHQEKVEAVIDPGSQIIAMSEAVSHDLGLSYDPSIRILLECANGNKNPSLGLSRNVACSIGGITLYLQIHVVRDAAYDILLGRPFDVLTQSTVKNFSNEDQTLTISDPNFATIATIPTQPRGIPQHRMPETASIQGFWGPRTK
jgi:hypothetical protein